jgi:predicted DNA-binding transcriptional regulator YafY
MTDRVTAEDRLRRLLWLLPVAAKPGGARLSALAAELGVEPRALLRDIDEAMTRSFHQPPGAVEPFTILYEPADTGDMTVEVQAPGEFQRPTRLSPGEALAVALGLRAMAVQTIPERDATLALATRIERDVAVPDVRDPEAPRASVRTAAGGRTPSHDVDAGETRAGAAGADADSRGKAGAGGRYDANAGGREGADIGGHVGMDDGVDVEAAVMDATTRRRRLRIRYIKPRAAPGERTVEPYRLVHAHAWYLLARDVAQDGVRLFRLDRIAAADIDEDASFEVPADFDPAAYVSEEGRPVLQEGVEAVVCYDAPAARWVAEAMGATLDDDGGLRIARRVADPAWLVRHVLAFGGAATVESPESARRDVARAAQAVAVEIAAR